MKYVREHINEKFAEDSDPINDMGIGTVKYADKLVRDIIGKPKDYTLYKYFPDLYQKTGKKIISGVSANVFFYILTDISRCSSSDDVEMTAQIAFKKYLKMWTINNGNDNMKAQIAIEVTDALERWLGIKLDPQNLNEAFSEDSDPINDMGIGLKHQIKEWMIQQFGEGRILAREMKIDRDMLINAEGIDLSDVDLSHIPEYIHFGKIKNFFASLLNSKKAVKRLPKKINGTLRIYVNVFPQFTISDIVRVCKVDPQNIHVLTINCVGYNNFSEIDLNV